MGDIYGKPPPPEPVPLGDVVTRFDGWIEASGTSPKGHYWFKLCVKASEKYKASLITDHPGRVLHFEVSLPIAQLTVLEGGKEVEGDVRKKIWAALGKETHVLEGAMDMTQGELGPGEVDWSEPER